MRTAPIDYRLSPSELAGMRRDWQLKLGQQLNSETSLGNVGRWLMEHISALPTPLGLFSDLLTKGCRSPHSATGAATRLRDELPIPLKNLRLLLPSRLIC